MKVLTTILATAAVLTAGAAAAVPTASNGLFVLATTGWADDRAAEGYGKAYDKTGVDGDHNTFTYSVATPWMDAAKTTLGKGEFLAPHFIMNFDGTVDIMVAPHLDVNGKVVKGLNANKDHFVRIDRDGMATRYDYSEDIAK